MSISSVNTSIPSLTNVVTATTGAPIVSFYTGDGTNGTNGTKYAVYKFIGSGSITLSASTTVDYLYIAGGGGSTGSGGGGAGGYLAGSTTLPSSTTTITVGAGGAGGASNTNGSNTVLGALTTAIGGGKSGSNGFSGGSGGGTTGSNPSTGGAGTAGQGYAGGNCTLNSTPSGGGGAGGAAPTTFLQTYNNTGGIPAFSYITGINMPYGRGGNGYCAASTQVDSWFTSYAGSGNGAHGVNTPNSPLWTGSSGTVILRFIVT